MPVDPRRAGGGSAEVRAAQRLADLERRLGQVERTTKGAVIGTGIVEQSGSFSLSPMTYDLITGMTLSIATQVATIAIVAFTGTIQSSGNVTIPAAAEMQLYKNGAIYGSATANLNMAPTAPSTNVVSITASIAHTWRVALTAGTTTLDLYGGGIGTLSDASLTYIQTRI